MAQIEIKPIAVQKTLKLALSCWQSCCQVDALLWPWISLDFLFGSKPFPTSAEGKLFGLQRTQPGKRPYQP